MKVYGLDYERRNGVLIRFRCRFSCHITVYKDLVIKCRWMASTFLMHVIIVLRKKMYNSVNEFVEFSLSSNVNFYLYRFVAHA